MDIGKVLFSPNGRIGQQDYWIGILILIGANLFLTWIPILGTLLWFVLIYVGICVYGKRLHDLGKSAWLHAAVWGVQFALGIVGFMMAGGAIMAAIANGGSEEAGLVAALAASGGLLMVFGIGFIIWIVYTIWLGVSQGESGANRFGPAPGQPQDMPAPVAAPVGETPPKDDTPTVS